MKAVEAVEIPPKMKLLPRDRRGYPIPWIVQRDLTGRAFFVMNDMVKSVACGRRNLCGICGKKLERDVWLIGGPGAAFHENGAYLDPPMHRACATYALKVCPYIGSRYSKRVDESLLKFGKWDPRQKVITDELMIPQQPPFFVMAKTAKATMSLDRLEDGGGMRFHPKRPWLAVEFWRHGQQLTEPEAREALAASDAWPWSPNDLMHWAA